MKHFMTPEQYLVFRSDGTPLHDLDTPLAASDAADLMITFDGHVYDVIESERGGVQLTVSERSTNSSSGPGSLRTWYDYCAQSRDELDRRIIKLGGVYDCYAQSVEDYNRDLERSGD